jgi:solute carrier family 25 phosphate transporter 3
MDQHKKPFLIFRLSSLPIMKTTGAVLLAPSPSGEVVHDAMYYLKGAAAGGICCSITHGALTPVDVVKTRVQLDPVKVGTFST